MINKFLILIAISLLFVGAAFAQQPLEFAVGSMNPVPNGPTTANQTAQLLVNPPPGTPSGIFVTATVSNQRFTGSGTGPGNPVVLFGATTNSTGSTVNSVPTFAPMNSVGSPANSMFSNFISGAPGGIDVATNYAFNLFTSVQHWANMSDPPTNSRVHMADLTLTFSQPLTNPYLHLVALGARFRRQPSGADLGFSTEFDLATPGLSLEKVQGNDALAVTATQINNVSSPEIDVSCANNTAACGTVRLIGTDITSVTFRVYIRGDGDLLVWSIDGIHSGDQWLIGVSIPSNLVTSAPADVSGTLRIGGSPIAKTLVVLTDPETNQRMVTRTDSEGNYRFAGLSTGKAYIVEPLSSRYTFSPGTSLVNLNDNVSGLNFGASRKGYTAKNDFDGDGKTDVAVYRPSDGNWFVLNSSTGEMSAFRFGAEQDRPVSGDYDGDGKTDYAVFRPSDSNWYIWQSASQSLRVERFGFGSDQLVQADYDGDGKTDVAVFRDGTWYIQRSSDKTIAYITFGMGSDSPVAADFDGDGKTDISVFRPSDRTWYIYRTSGGDLSAVSFGFGTDIPIQGDFDGDGKADVAQFRDGNWYVQNSTTGFEGSLFGLKTDLTVTGDFDGDGRIDATVFRDGVWYIRNSGNASVKAVSFGLPTDIVIR